MSYRLLLQEKPTLGTIVYCSAKSQRIYVGNGINIVIFTSVIWTSILNDQLFMSYNNII